MELRDKQLIKPSGDSHYTQEWNFRLGRTFQVERKGPIGYGQVEKDRPSKGRWRGSREARGREASTAEGRCCWKAENYEDCKMPTGLRAWSGRPGGLEGGGVVGNEQTESKRQLFLKARWQRRKRDTVTVAHWKGSWELYFHLLFHVFFSFLFQWSRISFILKEIQKCCKWSSW